MEMIVDKKCYAEVKEVINRFNKEEKQKIPNKIIELLNKETEGTEYLINIDPNKNLEEQISRQALSMLTYICLEYLADSKQKEELKNILIQNQKELVSSYKSVDELFNKKKTVKQEKNTRIVVVNNNIFHKIWTFLKQKFAKIH